jgi:hypothetical protein
MKQEDVLEYNKICADFLGLKFDGIMYRNSYEIMSFFPYLDYSRYPNELVFHSDWNWIMEVVEAIEKLYDSNIYFKISWNNITIGIATQYELAYETGFEGVEIHREGNKKEAVVKAINQFLIWYNENKNR